MSTDLVSVVIASYNHEKYVQETIKSIINQTYKNIEFIILDDGSSDNTWQKICELKEECEKRFTRVIMERQENAGASTAWAKANSYAKGEFVLSIASDDMLKPNAIEKEATFLINNPEYGLCVGDDEIIDSDGKVCYWDSKRNCVYDKKKAKYKTFGEYLESRRCMKFTSSNFGTYETLYCGNYIPNGSLTRQSFNSKLEPATPEAPLEDWFYMLQLSKYAKMKYLDEVLFSYRWHDTNTIKQTEKIKEYTQKTRDYEELLLDRIDRTDLIIDIDKIKKEGACYKKQGIPFIFEIWSYKKYKQKSRVIRVFGIRIFKYSKNV